VRQENQRKNNYEKNQRKEMLWHEKVQQEDARKDGIKSHEEDGT
jgi:hypothetical protein